MAKKSKTQRAKASANRAAKKQERARQEELASHEVEEAPKKSRFSFSKKEEGSKPQPKKTSSSQQSSKKAAPKPKKKRFAFLSDVRSEMRRVTWPTKHETLQWTCVVIVALLFFGVFVVVLDDWVVTPILLAISGLGA